MLRSLVFVVILLLPELSQVSADSSIFKRKPVNLTTWWNELEGKDTRETNWIRTIANYHDYGSPLQGAVIDCVNIFDDPVQIASMIKMVREPIYDLLPTSANASIAIIGRVMVSDLLEKYSISLKTQLLIEQKIGSHGDEYSFLDMRALSSFYFVYYVTSLEIEDFIILRISPVLFDRKQGGVVRIGNESISFNYSTYEIATNESATSLYEAEVLRFDTTKDGRWRVLAHLDLKYYSPYPSSCFYKMQWSKTSDYSLATSGMFAKFDHNCGGHHWYNYDNKFEYQPTLRLPLSAKNAEMHFVRIQAVNGLNRTETIMETVLKEHWFFSKESLIGKTRCCGETRWSQNDVTINDGITNDCPSLTL